MSVVDRELVVSAWVASRWPGALAWTLGGGLFWRYVGLRLDVAADGVLPSFVLCVLGMCVLLDRAGCRLRSRFAVGVIGACS